jgi:hypothetical protein
VGKREGEHRDKPNHRKPMRGNSVSVSDFSMTSLAENSLCDGQGQILMGLNRTILY